MFNDIFDFDFSDFDLFENLNILDIDMDGILNEIQNEQINKYYTISMIHWSNQEVMDFIHDNIEIKEKGHENYLRKFKCISGYIFKNLTEENCKLLAESNDIGAMIFSLKEKYLRCHPIDEFNYENNYIFDTNVTTKDLHNVAPASEFSSCFDENVKHNCRSRIRTKTISDKGVKRSEKVWEFLLHLLRDSSTCPQIIKWENFEEGTFRFVQSEKVARLWGNRKCNEKMNYEKFSRAMRYYYKSKILLPVPGKRLVYKFGPQATGWKNLSPIY